MHVMSMMSDSLTSSAFCEVDVCGVWNARVAARFASPSALLDWNNNYEAIPIRPSVPLQQFAEHFFKEW